MEATPRHYVFGLDWFLKGVVINKIIQLKVIFLAKFSMIFFFGSARGGGVSFFVFHRF